MEHVTPDRTIDWHTLEHKVIETDREGYSVYLSSPGIIFVYISSLRLASSCHFLGRRFIRGLMEEDPIQRFTMAQALEHEWFQFDQADSYTPPPPTTTDVDADACEALTSSFEEVTMQTMAPVDVERNATIIPAVGLSPPQPQGSEAAPGLTRLKNKGRALKRAGESQQLLEPSPEMLRNLSVQVAASSSAGASSPSSMEASTPDSVEACLEAEAGPSALGGNNKRKYAALTPPSPLNAPIHSTSSSESSFDLEPAMKKGKSRNPDKMDVSPKKLRRRVGQ
jgi:serine/threonine protein kinase